MRLSEQDASFLYTETASGPMQTAGILVIEGELSFDEVFEHYARRIHLVPRLRQRLIFVPMNLAHPKWADDPEFDVANHFEHHEIASGATVQEGLDRLCELNEGIMDRNRPLWKVFVLTGVKDRTLILQQVHHAMIDGASGIQMSTVLLDFEENPEPIEPESEPWAPPALPSAMELTTEALQENARSAMSASVFRPPSSDAREQLQRGFSAMTRFFTEPAITAPWNASVLGPKRKLVASEFDFAAFREIRRAFGGTINDVALTMTTHGAACYLEDHNEYAENQKLRLMCPVNVRTEGETGDLGNRVSAIFPMLPAYSMDMVERHRLVCEETAKIKEAGEAQAMTLMQENSISIPPMAMAPLLLVGTPFDPTRLAAALPPPVFPSPGRRPPSFGINFVVTNVPGVQVQQYLAGHKMLAMYSIMMMSGNLGLGIAIVSYNQKMIFNFTSDPRLMADVDLFRDHVNEGFNELLNLARKQNDTAAA